MGYRIVAEAAMAVHFAFLAYVVVGGFLAWRWPRLFWPHLAAAAWGAGIVVGHWNCPLTYAENWGRERAGERGLTTGFIDQYLEGVIYPARYTGLLQTLVFAAIAVSWLVLALRLRGGQGRPWRPWRSGRAAERAEARGS